MRPEDKRKDDPNRDEAPPPASPYGPQPHGADLAAGGADSSPYENLSSDEKEKLARERAAGQQKDENYPK